MKILFLYSELAGYFLANVERYYKLYGGEIHIVRWPINPEAPFNFKSIDGITFHEREGMNEDALMGIIKDIQPDLVYVTGWLDKLYFKLALKVKKLGIKTVCAMDNQWRGNFRQRMATFLSPIYLKNRFDFMWVPGDRQKVYAQKLGFNEAHIYTGLYCADTRNFENVFLSERKNKAGKFQHKFLYVGRFVELKGVGELCIAFQNVKKKIQSDWKLILVGAGPLKSQFKISEDIEVMDFVQPDQLPKLASEAGVFILPSHFEPWGVVLHEFAAAGLPIIASDACGAASAFVEDRKNGRLFEAGNQLELEAALRWIMEKSDTDLWKLGEQSAEMASRINSDEWAATLHEMAGGKP